MYAFPVLIQDNDDDIDPDEAQFLATYGDLIDDDDALSNLVEARKQQVRCYQ
jgi:hypothetical protein